MSYETIEVRPLTLRIGAEVGGVDMSRPVAPTQRDELVRAIADHQVIFFRDQHPTHDQHKAFGRAFGDLAIHSAVAGLDDHPEIVAIHADAQSTFVA
jgi:taurine dioxygenase